jgi:hypothetical protein
VNLLPVRDPGKRRVLPAEEDPGMPHHCDEEPGLTIGEAKRRERSMAFSGSTIRIRRVWFHRRCSDHREACCPYKRSEKVYS